MKKPEDILREPKYRELSRLVLTCEAMEDYAREVSIVALAKAQKEIETLRGQIVDVTFERDELDEWYKKSASQIRKTKFVIFAEDVSVFDKMQHIQKIFIDEQKND